MMTYIFLFIYRDLYGNVKTVNRLIEREPDLYDGFDYTDNNAWHEAATVVFSERPSPEYYPISIVLVEVFNDEY